MQQMTLAAARFVRCASSMRRAESSAHSGGGVPPGDGLCGLTTRSGRSWRRLRGKALKSIKSIGAGYMQSGKCWLMVAAEAFRSVYAKSILVLILSRNQMRRVVTKSLRRVRFT